MPEFVPGYPANSARHKKFRYRFAVAICRSVLTGNGINGGISTLYWMPGAGPPLAFIWQGITNPPPGEA
jgi:hypothetical protein